MAPSKQTGDPPAAKSAFWTNTNIEIYYFLYFSSIACIIPYLNVEFRRLGLTEGQIGVLEALRPWLSAPAGFAWAALADYFSLHRTLYLVLYTSGTLCRSLIAFGTTKFSWIMAIMLATEVLFGPSNIIADAVVVGSLEDSRDYGQLRAYGAIGWGLFALIGGSVISTWGIGVAWGMYGIGSALTLVVAAWYLPFETGAKSAQASRGEASDGALKPQKGKDVQLELKPLTSATHSQSHGDEMTVELADAGAHELVSEPSLPIPSVMKDHSGAQENAPEISFAVSDGHDQGERAAEFGSPRDMDPTSFDGRQPVPDDSRYAMEEDSDLPLYEDYNDRADQSSGMQKDEPPSFRELLRLVCSLPVALFIMLVLVMGSAVGVIDSFLFMYLEDLGASETLMGLTLTFTCIAEVPVFFCSNAILRALGTDNTLHVVVAAFVLRLMAYSTLSSWPTPWLVLPVELLHGITFGCAWAAGTSKSAELAPDGLGTSMQGIFQGSYFGVGRGIGALVGGLLYNKLGGAWMYRYAVLWVLVGWALQTVLNHILTRAPREEPAAPLIKATVSDNNVRHDAR